MSDRDVRQATMERQTRETRISCTVALAGGEAVVRTGLGFLDHMLESLAIHAGLGLELRCAGDPHVDDHHTVEDCAIVLGQALDRALGERVGIRRYGWAMAPMDEALARVAVDLATRPCAVVELGLRRDTIGDVACENLTHFFRSLAMNLRCALHVDALRGENDHHRAEAAFKATALALRAAWDWDGSTGARSAKGTL